MLLNLVEKLYGENEELRKEVQTLKDEINRLKGEKGKPDIKPRKSENISSEEERKGGNTTNRKTSRRKKRELPIHEVAMIAIDKNKLPSDVVFKGYSRKIVQGIKIEPYNILVKRCNYYSPSTCLYYTAEMPSRYAKEYSPELQARIIELKEKYQMTEAKILEFLQGLGIKISAGTISNIILENGTNLIPEQKNILKAGIEVSKYISTDTTEAIENGVKKQVHILVSEVFVAFFTRNDRKRTTVIDILRGTDSTNRVFAISNEFFELLAKKEIALKNINILKEYKSETLLKEPELLEILKPFEQHPNLHSLFYEFAYIAGFHAEEGFPIHTILLTDDASIYDYIFLIHALCWIHEGRHLKKLNPVVSEFRVELDKFITQFWNYYHTLLDFKLNPSEEYAVLLENKFDSLFSKKTNYEELNERILKTFAKKEELLVVLKNPSIPLHNNGSELGARAIVRERDVSLHTKNEDGTKARDVFLTFIHTAKKLGVNFFDYLVDRISGSFVLPSLAELILKYIPP